MSKIRKRNNAIRSNLEWLEDRTVMTVTLFVDFGDRFAGGLLGTTQGGLRDVANTAGANNPILGVELTDASNAYNAATPLNIVRQTYSLVERSEMMAVVQRAYLPLNINVVELTASFQATADGRNVRGAATMADVVSTLRSGPVASKDAYIFVAGFDVAPGAANNLYYGNSGGGTSPSNNGFGETTDLTSAMNLHDDVAVVTSFSGFNLNFANNISHEAGHTFGLRHAITGPAASADVNQYHNAEIMSYQNTNATTSSMFTRVPMIRGDGNSPGGPGTPLNYNDLEARNGALTPFDQLRLDPNVGANPNYTFVTGTGQNDTITIARSGANASITVKAFTTTTYAVGTDMVIPGTGGATSYSYLVPLTKPILVYAGDGNDRITVAGDLGIDVFVDGMLGTDTLIVNGNGLLPAVYTLGAVTTVSADLEFPFGAPVAVTSYSGAIAIGTETIRFSDFETSSSVTIQGVFDVTYRTSGGSDAITASSPTFSQTSFVGTVNGGTTAVPLIALNNPNLIFDLGTGDVAADANSLTLDFTANNILGGRTVAFTGGLGTDTIIAAKDSDFTLTPSQLFINATGTLALSSVERADLTGGNGANTFTVTDWTGGGLLTGAGGADTIVAVKNGDFTLADSSLATSDGMNLTLASVETANLTGGAGVNTFTVSGWTGGGTLLGAGGTDTVTATKNNNFTLADASLATSDGMNLALVSVEFAALVGGASANTFTVSGWTGGGILHGQGGFDALAVTKDRDFVLADGALFSTDALNLTLTSIETVKLTGGASGNMFDVTAYTGVASINGAGGTDRISAVKNSNFTLADNALAASDGLALTLASIEFAVLTGGAGDNTFSVGGWTGVASLDGLAGTDTISADKDSDFILSNSALTATDGLSVSLFSFEAAALGGGAGANTFAIADWTGAAQIVGAGGIDTVRIAGRATDDVVNVRVTDATGGGSFAGAGMTVGFATVENWNFDGRGGVNSLSWIDDTNTVWGTVAAPDTGIVFRPTGATSGDVRLGGGVGPTVGFDRIGGSFTIDGDGNASGDRDVLTVLGVSTAGLQSAGVWAETTSGNGADAIAVTDSAVTIVNSIAGALRGISFSTPTIGTLLVRTGNEGSTGGDTVVATPSVSLNILIDGMDPAGGVGDTIDVRIAGRRVEQRLPASGFGPAQTRIVRAADGAGLGFFNFELVRRPTHSIATGSTAGAPAEVRVFDALTGELRFDPIRPFDEFAGGVTVATGDINGDGIDDIVVGAGPGAGPRVSLYDGADGHLINTFFAFAPGFQGGVTVAAGDINGDGYADVVVGAGPGAGAHVKVFDGFTGLESMSFFAYDSGYKGGVTVAVGDLDGDGLAEVVTGMGSGGIPLVKAFRGSDGAEIYRFLAYDIRFGGGVTVAIGDIDGDGRGEIITGTETNGPAHVKIFRGGDAAELGSFLAFDPRFRGGVSVAARDLDGDGRDEILIGAGTGAPHVKGFRGLVGLEAFSLFSGDPRSPAGVNVG